MSILLIYFVLLLYSYLDGGCLFLAFAVVHLCNCIWGDES
jgi:hypothetical protein